MPEPTIKRGEEYFFPIIYEGNGKGQRVGNFVPFTDNGTINKSCIFEDGDTPTLSRTIGSASSTTTFTISCWVKRGNIGLLRGIWSREGANDNNELRLYFDSSNRLNWSYYPSGDTAKLTTNRTFEDTSKWYHIVAVSDTGNSTAAYRWRLYVDGDEVSSFATSTYPSQDVSIALFSHGSYSEYIGRARSVSTTSFDGYLAEFNIVDGSALTPSTFGLTDTSTGRWIPKTLTGITYGNTGRRLTFANSAGQTIGDDTSGNTNDFTVNNLAASDIVTDTPTDLYPTLSDFQTSYGGNYSEGNLKIDGSTNGQTSTGRSTLSFDVEDSTGYYFEFRNMGTSSFGSNFNAYGIVGVNADNIAPSSGNLFPNGGHHVTLQEDGNVRINNTGTNLNLGGSTLPKTGNTSTRDTIGCAVKSGKVWFSKNGIWGNANQGNPNSDGTPIASGLTGRFRACALCYDDDNSLQEVNFGQRLALGGSATSDYSANNGGYFLYPPPTGFRAIKQDNLPETEKGITSMTWVKNRETTNNPMIIDSSRGQNKHLYVDRDDAELDYDQRGMIKFLKGGYSCGEYNFINGSGNGLVSWNWVANAGTTASNGNGSITSTVQANQTAGFSIVQYTGTGSNATVGHGLSSAPDWILVKNLSTGSLSWTVQHKVLTATSYLHLDLSNTSASTTVVWNDTNPTSTVFSVGTANAVNKSSSNMIAYCWHSVEGFSKFSSFVGNGNSNGPFVFTGFKPALVIIKSTSHSNNWIMWDNKRSVINPCDNVLYPDLNQAETTTGNDLDFLSNGFKCRGTNTNYNGSSRTYIYMAFAEHPFIGDGTNPVTAR